MAHLHCHCATAHRLGAKPAPYPAIFPQDELYLRIRDEEGRLWLWRVDEETLNERQDQQTKTIG